MSGRGGFLAGAALAAVLAVPWSGGAVAAADGVRVAFSPASLTVTPGAEFELELQVTETGASFNGFKAIVGFDPAALTPLPLDPVALQQGELMTDACGNTFHSFRAGAEADTASSILLCNGVSVSGPGRIYRLRFRATDTPRQTTVRFLSGTRFYDAGLFVTPVVTTDASVGIGMPPAAVGGAPPPPSLAAVPNPGRSGVVFRLGTPRPGTRRITVRDPQGRVIRNLVAGGREAAWDGRHELGGTVPGGTYFATLEADGRSTTIRFVLLR